MITIKNISTDNSRTSREVRELKFLPRCHFVNLIGRTSREVRELKWPSIGGSYNIASRTSREVRELKSVL